MLDYAPWRRTPRLPVPLCRHGPRGSGRPLPNPWQLPVQRRRPALPVLRAPPPSLPPSCCQPTTLGRENPIAIRPAWSSLTTSLCTLSDKGDVASNRLLTYLVLGSIATRWRRALVRSATSLFGAP